MVGRVAFEGGGEDCDSAGFPPEKEKDAQIDCPRSLASRLSAFPGMLLRYLSEDGLRTERAGLTSDWNFLPFGGQKELTKPLPNFVND